MKGFIELNQNNNGKVSLNVLAIFAVEPLSQGNANCRIKLLANGNTQSYVTYQVSETYDMVLALIAEAMR